MTRRQIHMEYRRRYRAIIEEASNGGAREILYHDEETHSCPRQGNWK